MEVDAVTWRRQALGRRPVVTVRAPGRVNLIGDHTDHQEGFCLPVAIDRAVVVAAVPRSDPVAQVTSRELPGADAGHLVAALIERGHAVVGADLALTSTVPVGSGLSSSAACNVALALAIGTLAGAPAAGNELALVAQRAEHLAGVPCGIMDQMASVHGRAGYALLLDCRTLAIEPIALPAAVAIIVVHSGLPRALADSEYARRRAACDAAARRLGVATLRDVPPDAIELVSDDPFARHVVSENARVLELAAALRSGALNRFGPLLDASHESLARDFAVSTPELDLLCMLLRDAGALGARLTGAGFGGCVVALAPAGDAPAIVRSVADRYRAATGREPLAFVAVASDGAGVVEADDDDDEDDENDENDEE